MVSQVVAPQLLMSCLCTLLTMVTEQGLCPLDQETTERLCRGLFLALYTTRFTGGGVVVVFQFVSCVSTHSKNFVQFCYTLRAG